MFLTLALKPLISLAAYTKSTALVLTHQLTSNQPTTSLFTVTPFFTPVLAITMDDNTLGSCPQNPPLSTTKRTDFGRLGCTIYGYPSSGGVLIKEADIVDMHFLSLDRFYPSQRSSNTVEEDRFCALMRRVGAIWWASEQEWVDVELGLRERIGLEMRVLVFGWPTDGVGVWVLRFGSERELPRDFGRVGLAVNMDERIRVMKEYGALYYDDAGLVEELKEGS